MFAAPFSLVSLLLNRFLWKVVALVLVLVGVFAFGYHRGYDSGFDDATKKYTQQVKEAESERDHWKAEYRGLESKIKANAKAWAAALEEQKAHGDKVVSELKTKIERFRRENVKLKGELSDTKKFVSVAADRACTIPVGFVWLHNAAASGNSADLPTSTATGTPGNADAPSGIALSQVAETAAYNYALAHTWRVQVIAWQDWYEQWRSWYTDHQKALDKSPPGR